MFYTGLDPYTLKEIYVARDPHEKALQRALLQYFDPNNYALVEEALKKAGRYDLIGNGEKCLIRPRGGTNHNKKGNRGSGNYGSRRSKKKY